MSSPDVTPTTDPSWLLAMRRGQAALLAAVSVGLNFAVTMGWLDADPTGIVNEIARIASYVVGLISSGFAVRSAFKPNSKQAVSIVLPPSA